MTPKDSPLGRLLFDKDDDGNIAAFGSRPVGDGPARARLAELRDRGARRDRVEESKLGPARALGAAAGRGRRRSPSLRSSASIDWTWRRTSFSDITAGSYEATVASEPGSAFSATSRRRPRRPPPSRARTRSGCGRSGPASDAAGEPRLRDAGPPGARARGLRGARPRGGAGSAARRLQGSLAAVGAATRRSSSAPCAPRSRRRSAPRSAVCAAGSRARRSSRRARLRAAARRRRSAGRARDPRRDRDSPLALRATIALRAYAGRLSDPSLRQSVRGYLAGSIDLVGRFDAADGPRFFIVDYKTNWLGAAGRGADGVALPPRSALSVEMARHHYLLQGTLYAAALHRYLRWRVPGLRPGP